MAAYAVWGGLLFLCFNLNSRIVVKLVLISILALFFGGTIEFLQQYTGRNPELMDIVANIAGAVLGAFFVIFLYNGLWVAFKALLLFLLPALTATVIVVIVINLWVVYSTKDYTFVNKEDLRPAQAILILGAGVYPGNRVSRITYDRLVTGAEVFKQGLSDTILVSGDNGTIYYDEVNTIKNWLIEFEVPDDSIRLDHAGFSTYESIYRAKAIFRVESLIIVTQKFHLPRALYMARHSGLSAQGIVADRVDYVFMGYNNLREALARTKDFINIHILRPLPRFLGEIIPIS